MTAQLEDMQALQALVVRYNINGDRGRVDVLGSCFAEDGVLEFNGKRGVGPAGVASALSGGMAQPGKRFIRHNLTTREILIADDGMTATGRLYFFVMTNHGIDHAGVYVDRYRKDNGQWKIAHREVRIDWQVEHSYREGQPYQRGG